MDPLLFGINSDVVIEVLGTIVLLSLFVERLLAPFFEWRILVRRIANKGAKEPIALGVSFLVAYTYGFDALAIVFSEESSSLFGYILTAGIIAGGSKGSIKLFRDFLGWKSGAQRELEQGTDTSDGTAVGSAGDGSADASATGDAQEGAPEKK